jgi:hypothetical protein
MLTVTAGKPSGEHTLFHVNGPPRVPNMAREADAWPPTKRV